jgi:hypothetical protein
MSITQAFGLDALVERRIAAAIARGEFDNLPGAGRPLALDDDLLVPQELRVAWRLLKNAGCVPPELAQVAEVNRLLGAVSLGEADDGERSAGVRRLRALLMQLEVSGRTATAQAAWQQYGEALRGRCDRRGSARARPQRLDVAAAAPHFPDGHVFSSEDTR